jgi:hypothetical protein
MKLIDLIDFIPAVLLGVVVLGSAIIWIRRRPKNDPYDLRRLNESAPEPVPDAYDDMVTSDSGPYCVRCDHPNPEGTYYCKSCGQRLG